MSWQFTNCNAFQRVNRKYTANMLRVYSKYAASIQASNMFWKFCPWFPPQQLRMFTYNIFAFCLLLLVIPLYEVIMSSLSSLILLKTFWTASTVLRTGGNWLPTRLPLQLSPRQIICLCLSPLCFCDFSSGHAPHISHVYWCIQHNTTRWMP